MIQGESDSGLNMPMVLRKFPSQGVGAGQAAGLNRATTVCSTIVRKCLRYKRKKKTLQEGQGRSFGAYFVLEVFAIPFRDTATAANPAVSKSDISAITPTSTPSDALQSMASYKEDDAQQSALGCTLLDVRRSQTA